MKTAREVAEKIWNGENAQKGLTIHSPNVEAYLNQMAQEIQSYGEEVKEACAKRCDFIVDVLPDMAETAKRQAKGCADSIRALDLTGEKQ